MDVHGLVKGSNVNWLKTHSMKIIHSILLISIVFGLALKFFISQSIHLGSDSIASGLAVREIFTNNNFFLINFYTPQTGPGYFTDTYTFQLIPQIVSNFSPFAFKSVGFGIFCLIIIVFGFLIWKISKNVTTTLVFAALVANLTPLAYVYYAEEYHIGTIFFIGILMILLIRFPDIKLPVYAISLIILLLVVISDSLAVIWFVLSGLLYYAYTYYLSKIDWKKLPKIDFKKFNTRGLWFVVISVIAVLLVNSFTKSVPYFTSYLAPLNVVGPGTSLEQAVMFCKNMILLYNSTINQFFFNKGALNILDYVTIIAAIALALYSIILLRKNIHQKLVIFCLCSILSGFLFFSFTNVVPVVRYLLFYGIILFVGIAIMYNKNDRIFISLVFCVLIFNGVTNLAYVQTIDKNPNQPEYELIAFLESNNLHYGLADYWDSNIITYLSNGRVTIRAISGYNGEIGPFRWLAAESWYSKNEMSKTNFIMVLNTSPEARPFLNRQNFEPFLAKNPPIKTLHFRDYNIYTY